MTAAAWGQLALFSVLVLATTRPLGIYMHRVFESDRRPLPRLLGPIERFLFRLSGVDPDAGQTWVRYAGAVLVLSVFSLLVTYGILRLQHLLPLNPAKFGAVDPWLSFNTAASFTTNTNWQAYTGESTMSYLSQMAGLAWHNFISAAAGIAVAIALARGLTRRQAPEAPRTLGNFWADLIRATVYVLLPAEPDLRPGPRQPGGDPELLGVPGGHHARGGQAGGGARAGGLAGGDQGAGHQRRRLLQRQQRPPLREPEPLHQPDRAVAHLRHPRRADLHLREDGPRPSPGVGDPRGDGRALPRRDADRALGRVQAQPGARLARARPRGRKHGGQGGPLRHRGLGALRHRDHRRLVRRGELDARQLQSARRAGPAGQHPARRGHLRRSGRRPLRDAGLRRALGLHRRADGGPHAGVPGEEDREPGDEAGDALRAHLPSAHPRVHRLGVGDPVGDLVPEQRRAARAQRDALRLHQRHGEQRFGLRRAERQHPLVQHPAGADDARGALPDDRSRARHRRGHGRQEGRPSRGPGPFPPTGRSSPFSSSRWC